MVFLFMGPSGSGKDTQAELLAQKISNSIVISTGAILRQALSMPNHKYKDEISKCLNEGKWVPDHIVYELLGEMLQTITSEHIMFTGAIRTAAQVPLLDEQLQKLNKKVDGVFYLRLAEEIVMERLLGRGRADDNRVAIQSRLDQFQEHTGLIYQEYSERGVLHEVDAAQSIEAIHDTIVEIIKNVYEINIS